MNARGSRDELLFSDALARFEEERAAYIKGACKDDAAVKDRVLALLKTHPGSESLLAGAPIPEHYAGAILHEEKPGEAESFEPDDERFMRKRTTPFDAGAIPSFDSAAGEPSNVTAQ